ncbi:Zinc finger C2H2 [Penicillium angulare]|uniref:Zinc finger C2H2 n=1 Tax=Penicillium angulare TaxID=116970 RepID=UPI0025421608|nr:Zinc finger C2H2 [Penicillium angulare]KAJ5281304.1 Zinc finger C2H2 [Penicillium angulare]
MASQPQTGDFCLECKWEGFHIDGKSEEPAGEQPRAEWTHSDQEHHAAVDHTNCEVDEACCDVDDCSIDCGSVCDGFVDCDASTVCSVAHCDDTHCDTDHCDTDHCEGVDPNCFDDPCCEGVDEHNCEFDAFFGLNSPLSLDTPGILPTVPMNQHAVAETGKFLDHTLPGIIDPCYHQDFLSSYQTHATHCDQNVANHFECHDFQKELQGIFPLPQLPTQTDVNPTDVFQMLGVCPDYSIHHDPHLCHDHTMPAPLEAPKPNIPDPLNCFQPHPEHHHVHHQHNHFKSPNDLDLHIGHGPHRNHHRCRGHHHTHAHPYSPYSRQSRSSISSQFLSSPGETPPPLDGGVSSVLTTPDFSAEDNDVYMCKWTMGSNGVRAPCGATFRCAGALQDHLVSSHMNTVEGAKGNGYYCCWEGCHRPEEPFSQKSKLQGHFLTHSNCALFAGSPLLVRQHWIAMSAVTAETNPIDVKTAGKRLLIAPTASANTNAYILVAQRVLLDLRHQRTTHKEPSSTLPSPSPDHFTLTPFTMV